MVDSDEVRASAWVPSTILQRSITYSYSIRTGTWYTVAVSLQLTIMILDCGWRSRQNKIIIKYGIHVCSGTLDIRACTVLTRNTTRNPYSGSGDTNLVGSTDDAINGHMPQKSVPSALKLCSCTQLSVSQGKRVNARNPTASKGISTQRLAVGHDIT